MDVIHIGTVDRRKEVLLRWTASPFDWVTLNIDGASKGNQGLSGAGGIVRDSSGQLLVAFAEKLGISTVTRAESMALKRGLAIAMERKFPRLIIQTNSGVVEGFMKAEDLLPLFKYVSHSSKTRHGK